MVGPWQWIIIGLAILLLFGGKKIDTLDKDLIKAGVKGDAEEERKKMSKFFS